MSYERIVGLDLGTTNSLVAVLAGGEPVVITTAEGSRQLLSIVALTKTGERLVGQMAKRQAVSGATATGPGGPERPGDNGRGEPHGEDVVEGEYQKMLGMQR